MLLSLRCSDDYFLLLSGLAAQSLSDGVSHTHTHKLCAHSCHGQFLHFLNTMQTRNVKMHKNSERISANNLIASYRHTALAACLWTSPKNRSVRHRDIGGLHAEPLQPGFITGMEFHLIFTWNAPSCPTCLYSGLKMKYFCHKWTKSTEPAKGFTLIKVNAPPDTFSLILGAGRSIWRVIVGFCPFLR